MKFVLFVEGHTEKQAIPGFLKRWLDAKLRPHVGVKPVRFDGWRQLVKVAPGKAAMYLKDDDVIAVIALLDLYGPTFYPDDVKDASERYQWAKKHIEDKVRLEQFHQFFAVHELEAWLLSDPRGFPREIAAILRKDGRKPEDVNFDEPPAKLLDQLYTKNTRRKYKKVTHGRDLFSKLDPNVAYEKCPQLKELLDALLRLAKDEGL